MQWLRGYRLLLRKTTLYQASNGDWVLVRGPCGWFTKGVAGGHAGFVLDPDGCVCVETCLPIPTVLHLQVVGKKLKSNLCI